MATVFSNKSVSGSDRAFAALLAVVGVAGCALGFNGGQLPRRGEPAVAQSPDAATETGGDDLAADLALYRDVVADVRSGQGYYDAAARRIPQYGFPTSSPLNWRLPTYAWLFSRLPGLGAVQAVLVVLSAAALVLAFSAQARTVGPVAALFTTALLVGVAGWSIDGYAFLAQEPWAATLLVISLAAHGLARSQDGPARSQQREGTRWSAVSIAAGTAALLFRELAFPYCVLACLFAAGKRRWHEAAGWAAGIMVFVLLMTWHIAQVKLHTPSAAQSTAGLSQWLRFGGLDFLLLTTRMNSLLFTAPGWLLWLYLLVALLGLASRCDETSQLACLAALGYLLVFAVLGRPENFYWGLLPAPLLVWGASSGPGAIVRLWQSCGECCRSPMPPCGRRARGNR